MKKIIVPILLALLLVGWATAVLAFENEADKVGAQVGQLSPEIELNTFEDKPFTLKYSVKPLIIIFGTSWSVPCQNELLEMKELYTEKGNKLEIFAVLFDKKTKEAKNFVYQHKFPFPVLPDKKLTLLGKFPILILPTTYLIRDRTIEKIIVDYDSNTKKSIEEWLKS